MSNSRARIEINRRAKEYNEGVNTALERLIRPALDHFGITFFNYNQYPEGNRFLTIGTDVKWYREFFENDLDRFVFFDDPRILKKQEWRVVWDFQQNSELLDRMRAHNYCHGFTVFRRTGKLIEAWSFATSIENFHLNSFYLNYFHLIDQFIRDFNQNIFKLIPNYTKHFSMYHNEFNLKYQNDKADLNQEVYRLGSGRHHTLCIESRKVQISRRELQCLHELSNGKTIKEIAAELTLAPKTVEKYLNSIKTKTNSDSRSSLVALYREIEIASDHTSRVKRHQCLHCLYR